MIETKKPRGRGRPFKKGNKSAAGNKNQLAKPQYDREELSGRHIDNRMVNRYLTLNLHLTIPELEYRLKHEKLSILEGMVIRSLLGAYQSSDFAKVNEILNRTIGKVPDRVMHSADDKYAHMSDEELMAEKRRLSDINRKTLERIEQEQRMIESSRDVTEQVATPVGDSRTKS